MFTRLAVLGIGLVLTFLTTGCCRNRCCTRPQIVGSVPIAPVAPAPAPCCDGAPGGGQPVPAVPPPIPGPGGSVSRTPTYNVPNNLITSRIRITE